MASKTLRCDVVVVQIIATEVDDQGRPIGEMTSQPAKVFRATTEDFWAHIDKVVVKMQESS